MKELTRIIKVQLTDIVKCEDEYELMSKEAVTKALKDALELDDVVVERIQDFEMECEL